MAYQPTADLTSICLQIEVKHPANLGMTWGQHIESLSRRYLPSEDYRCKSIAAQVHHNAGIRTRNRCLGGSDSASALF